MPEQSKRKILVVDVEPDAVEFVRTVMEEAGYEVVDASGGAEGIEKARAESPALVILDVQMPGKDGFSTFADMRADPELKDTPVIMLTGVGERMGIRFSSSEMGEYLGEEPSAYIEKPVDPEALQQAVEDALGA